MKQKIFDTVELPNVKNIIVVASGKGGVGKSTISANMAVVLARQGMKVALVDADLYGPSIPMMFGLQDESLSGGEEDGKEVIYPLEKYGVKISSIGFLVNPGQSLIWRGPMASNALTQLYSNTKWGDIDYMIIDFPPGTGDIQLTTVQKLNVSGGIVVTTPQDVAISDARKAASMFNNPDIKVPVIGVIENMSWFTPAKHPDEKYYVFGKGGGEKLANELNTKLLGQIPLVMEIGEGADKGLNIYNQKEKSIIEPFEQIVQSIINKN